MCGIFLAISKREAIDRNRFDRARDMLRHRGPDAEGTVVLEEGRVALGHRRLAIIDLSAAGNQPMQLDNLHVTFNGEIYNYPRLRKELEGRGCTFRTRSDTEVLLHGYRTWGEDMCARLEGMFAFAIWDESSGALFAARDHTGQKPFHYYATDTDFVAASEIKAIAGYLNRSFRLRHESLVDTLYFDFVPEPNTWYREVLSLPPGHRLTVSTRNEKLAPKVRQYWNFTPPLEPRAIDSREAGEQLAELLESTVHDHLLADVEVGSFLSGGVDSAGITLLASRYTNHPIKTFSIGFGDDDAELERAEQSARRIGTVHTAEILQKEAFQETADMALGLFDQPFSDTSLVPTERVAALAAKQVKVVLTGDGGDEVFGGYQYGRHLSPWLDTKRNPGGIAKKMLLGSSLWLNRLAFAALGETWWLRHHDPLRREVFLGRLRGLFGEDIAKKVKDYDPAWAIEQHRIEGLDPFRQAQWSGIKLALPGKMLVKVDRCTMVHSLESRAPLLAPRLMEFLLSLPTPVKNPNADWYKGLYRTYLRGRIPDSVIDAPKRGFATPSEWSPLASPRGAADLALCVGTSVLRPESLRRITGRPRLLWKFLQIERALEKNLLAA